MGRELFWKIWSQLWLLSYAGNQQIIKASTEIQHQLGDKIPFPPKKIPGEKKIILIMTFFQKVYNVFPLHLSLNNFGK